MNIQQLDNIFIGTDGYVKISHYTFATENPELSQQLTCAGTYL